MTVLDAVRAVYSYLKTQSLGVDVYQYTKPARIVKDEFIAINSLSANEGKFLTTFINCNIFVNDLEPGTPNNSRLKTLAELVKSKFPYYSDTERANMYLTGTETTEDDRDGRHYVNIKLKVEMLNLPG